MTLLHHQTRLVSAAVQSHLRAALDRTFVRPDQLAPDGHDRASAFRWTGGRVPLPPGVYGDTMVTREELIEQCTTVLATIRVTLEIPDGYGWRRGAEDRNAWLDEQFAALGHEVPDELRYRNRYFQSSNVFADRMGLRRELATIRLAFPWSQLRNDWVGHHSVMLKARLE